MTAENTLSPSDSGRRDRLSVRKAENNVLGLLFFRHAYDSATVSLRSP